MENVSILFFEEMAEVLGKKRKHLLVSLFFGSGRSRGEGW